MKFLPISISIAVYGISDDLLFEAKMSFRSTDDAEFYLVKNLDLLRDRESNYHSIFVDTINRNRSMDTQSIILIRSDD